MPVRLSCLRRQLLLAVFTAVAADVRAAGAQPAGAEAVVRAFVAAYNRHDVPGLLSLADTAIAWLSIEGDSVRVETRGREALGRALSAYFRRLPSARSTIQEVSALGAWVSARERAEWTAASGRKSQAALSVYEVRQGRIRRVWYYPVADSVTPE